MTNEDAIEYGQKQLEIFGGEHRQFIEKSLEALEAANRPKEYDKGYQSGYDAGYKRAMLDYGLEDDKPCEDTVSRKAVLALAKDVVLEDGCKHRCIDATQIHELPPVTPKQRTGKWIWQTEDIYRCSKCGEEIHVKEVMNVPQYICCPMCGEKMEGAQE